MSADETPEGRFFLLSGAGADDVARALTARLPRAASVDGPVVGAMFGGDAEGSGLEQTFLRYTAGIALADSFRLAGYDAVVADDVPAEHLEAYLDFASPTPIHLVRLGASPAGDLPGLGLTADAPDAFVEEILARLPESVVETETEQDTDDR